MAVSHAKDALCGSLREVDIDCERVLCMLVLGALR